MIDTLLPCILLLTTFTGPKEIKLYITDHYVLMEADNVIEGSTHIWLHDGRAETFYTFTDGEVSKSPIEPNEWGQERGWKAVGFETVALEYITDTIYQNTNCILLRGTVSAPDIFNPGQKYISYDYKIMCRSPEIERLPMQTRLAIPNYREWGNEEYPLLLRWWGEEAPSLPIVETQVMTGQYFPLDRVREWFGIEIKP